MIEVLLTAIPLQGFDQHKLEALLTKIPSAFVKSETYPDFERKFFTFPAKTQKDFQISCQSDYFFQSAVASNPKCSLIIFGNLDDGKDEQLMELKDPYVVKSLYGAISYGSELKKMHSLERVYGLSLNGKYRRHFRYTLTCSIESCQLTMSTKPAAKLP